jgi:hypothetical protein
MSAVRLLLGEKRTSRGQPISVAIDPNATMDAWKDGGAPRCQAGLECLTPSAQLMVAGPPLLMWNNVGTLALGALAEGSSSRGRFDMSAIIKSEMISRRKALSLMGLAAAFGLAAAPTVLTVSDAEAQTVGMERRQERRGGRHERREVRRTGRHERREVRRTGTNTAPGTTTGAAK